NSHPSAFSSMLAMARTGGCAVRLRGAGDRGRLRCTYSSIPERHLFSGRRVVSPQRMDVGLLCAGVVHDSPRLGAVLWWASAQKKRVERADAVHLPDGVDDRPVGAVRL